MCRVSDWSDVADWRHGDLRVTEHLIESALYWVRDVGIDGFRCDAGYMIPLPVWRYVVARVRQEFPQTIFLLEGLGGEPAVTEELLASAGLDWAYSELFQNYHRSEIETYLPRSDRVAATKGTLVHFAETHDNPRLAARSAGWARLRTALSSVQASPRSRAASSTADSSSARRREASSPRSRVSCSSSRR